MKGAPPLTTDQWVTAAIEATAISSAQRRGQAFVGSSRDLDDDELRAPLKERIVFGPAGRAVVRTKGERIIYGPNGARIRVVEHPEGGNQIEHDEHLHAVIRPTSAAVVARSRSN